jgi:hypothetical protein
MKRFRPRWSLRTLLLAVAIFSFPCAWYEKWLRGHECEEVIIARLAHLKPHVEREWLGPAWLSALKGVMPGFLRITTIDVAVNNESPAHCSDADLAKICQLESVHEVGIWDDEMTDDRLGFLENCKSVQILDISSTRITNRGATALAELKQLYSLSVLRTAITDVGVRRLVKLPNLVSLNLNETAVTDASIDIILSSPRIEWASISNTYASSVGEERLDAALIRRRGEPVTNEGR